MKSLSKSQILVTSAMILGVMFLSSCEGELEVVQAVNEEFSGIQSVQIESGFLDVNYQGDPNAKSVILDAIMESNKAGKYNIKYRVDQNQLIIDLEQTGSFGGGRHRGYLNLTGPEIMAVDVEIGSGSAVFNKVKAPTFEVQSGSGSIDLFNISSPEISLQISSGTIEGDNIIGNISLEVSSGNSIFNNVKGNINAEGSSGKLALKDIDGLVNAKINSGNMEFDSIRELGFLQVSSGNISVIDSGLGLTSRFKSSSGNVRIQTFSSLDKFNYDLDAGSGRVTVGEVESSKFLKINNGASYTIIGSVSSGNIEIKN